MITKVIDKTNNYEEDHLSSPKSRGHRLKLCRNLLGISRDTLQAKYGIARGTIQNWETPRSGGLTEVGAEACIQAFQAEGLQCTVSWLLHGLNSEPYVIGSGDVTKHTHISHKRDQVTDLLLKFRTHQTNPIEFIIDDDSMKPIYNLGDFVAGNAKYMDDIQHCVDQICIVQVANQGTMLRYITISKLDPHKFDLIAVNPSAKVEQPVIYNAKVYSASPVLFHFKFTT